MRKREEREREREKERELNETIHKKMPSCSTVFCRPFKILFFLYLLVLF
jgi:hypothetical protein